MIEIINAKVGLNKVILRAQLTLEELEKKAPQKKRLIANQKDSLKELNYAKHILHRMDLKCMALSSQVHSLNTLLLKLKHENIEQKQTIKNLIDNAEM